MEDDDDDGRSSSVDDDDDGYNVVIGYDDDDGGGDYGYVDNITIAWRGPDVSVFMSRQQRRYLVFPLVTFH